MAAVVVWRAGVRLAVSADLLAERTGIGRAVIGALLLGGITSLPEATTTVAAAAIGSPALAVNNVIGGVAMQVVVLALVDARLRQNPLALEVVHPEVMLQATLLILLLAITAAGTLIGDFAIIGLGAWTLVIFACALLSFALLQQNRQRETWKPQNHVRTQPTGNTPPTSSSNTQNLLLGITGLGFVILLAGIVLTYTADALAIQTGLGASLVGAVLLALATSLPELSTTVSAIRIGQHTMAYSNIFGANILDLSLLFLADIAYVGNPVLNHVGKFAVGMALLGIVLTAACLVGLLERRRLMIWRFRA